MARASSAPSVCPNTPRTSYSRRIGSNGGSHAGLPIGQDQRCFPQGGEQQVARGIGLVDGFVAAAPVGVNHGDAGGGAPR
jgi:hypothetical protein